MTNAEILKKAIEKAIENGFDITKAWGYSKAFWETKSYAAKIVFCEGLTDKKDYVDCKSIIFAHDFSKAFWGDEQVDKENFRTIASGFFTWQYHLQQMVLEEDPVKYLEQFLKS